MMVGDEKFGPATAGHGAMSIQANLIGDPGISWPTSAGQEFERFFIDGAREARSFITDRSDLGTSDGPA